MIEFFIGLVLGYISISVCESLSHSLIGHAPSALRRIIGAVPGIGWLFIRSWFGHHIVHHRLTFRTHFAVQFESEEHKNKLNHILNKKKYTNMYRSVYGLGVGNFFDVLLFIMPTSFVFAVLCAPISGMMLIGFIVPIILMPIASNCIHPYIHTRAVEREFVDSRLLQFIFKTSYFKYIIKMHWLHHKYENCNYNLVPLGDYILRCHRPPMKEDMESMIEQGIIR